MARRTGSQVTRKTTRKTTAKAGASAKSGTKTKYIKAKSGPAVKKAAESKVSVKKGAVKPTVKSGVKTRVATKAAPEYETDFQYCAVPEAPVRPIDADVEPFRLSLIRAIEKKWVNGTVLNYYFFDSPSRWKGPEPQKQAVRDAFAEWKGVGIGLEFREVSDPQDAEFRIGFESSAGSWSYVGRDAIDYASDPAQRTMNFGWDLTTPYGRDTALHEIGHACGYPHEHQNPNAGIEWNEPAVIAYFSGPPNNWDEAQIRHNILRKIDPALVEGSAWDRDSIMHYYFNAGLISQPDEFQTNSLIPAAGLSKVDKERVRKFYPPITRVPQLKPYQSQRLRMAPGDQVNFLIEPDRSRKYTIQTFGRLDTVMVLFEEIDGTPTYLEGDDDSGSFLNAEIRQRLFKGRRYIVRIRLYHAEQQGEGVLMMW